MNYKKFKLLLLLCVSGVLYGNSIVGYKVEITHPVLRIPPKPLVIKEIIKWHHGRKETYVSEYYPMMFIQKLYSGGKEGLYGKSDWRLFYDAFIKGRRIK